jgi:hypothetical protein
VNSDVIDRRLRNQQLTRSTFRDPADVVAWLGAVQSQDYPGAKWGVALRTPGLTSEAFDRAFDDGRILRTHVLRPTWHFVPRADIRWMLFLTAPRLRAALGTYVRRLELDPRALTRSRSVFARALGGGKALTRAELADALARAGIAAKGQRLAAIVMDAELDQLLCSGPLRGRQFTYMLLDERAPDAPILDRDAALAELTRRFFRSHGPATLRDFVWWSGLTTSDARAGLESIRKSVVESKVNGLTYWMQPSRAVAPPAKGSVYLLPNYDEYLIAYKDRGSVEGLPITADAPRGFDIYAHFLIVDGQFAGTWRRHEKSGAVRVSTTPFRPFNRSQAGALSEQVDRLGRFLGLPVTIHRVDERK